MDDLYLSLATVDEAFEQMKHQRNPHIKRFWVQLIKAVSWMILQVSFN